MLPDARQVYGERSAELLALMIASMLLHGSVITASACAVAKLVLSLEESFVRWLQYEFNMVMDLLRKGHPNPGSKVGA